MARQVLAIATLLLATLRTGWAQDADLLKKAQEGDPAAEARLGYAYYKGEGVPQDYDNAAKWLQKSADTGSPTTGLIPLVGPIIILVFMLQDSQPNTNQYGPNPKAVLSGSMAGARAF